MMESNKSLALKELSNILDLATCDDTLFNDGINLEIEACAKKGIEVLDNKEIVYVIMETYGIDPSKDVIEAEEAVSAEEEVDAQ